MAEMSAQDIQDRFGSAIETREGCEILITMLEAVVPRAVGAEREQVKHFIEMLRQYTEMAFPPSGPVQ